MLAKHELEKVTKYLGAGVAAQLVELDLASVSDEPVENVLLVLFDVAAAAGLKSKDLHRMVNALAKKTELDGPPKPKLKPEPTTRPGSAAWEAQTYGAPPAEQRVVLGRNIMIGPDGVEVPVDFEGRTLSGQWELTLTSYDDRIIQLSRLQGPEGAVNIPPRGAIRIRGGIGMGTYSEINGLRCRGRLGVSARRP